jgi:DNA polymerase elongation subunit (family B)/DNA-directed RNA polymerase subunit RPC12/RpoP
MKILAIDIETAPNSGYFWGLFKQNISINHLMETSRVMCFAAKWVGAKGKVEFWSEHEHGHKATIRRAHQLLDEADAVITYNGNRFDLPVLNKEFIKLGLTPPMPYASIDLYPTVRRRFKFASNKLDHVARELGLTPKVKHEGFELWVKCMDGDDKAWTKMQRYNKGDVTTLIELYQVVLPWIQNHPNVALYADEAPETPTCTNCGSDNLVRKGEQVNLTHKYRRYKCRDCGTPVRSRYTHVVKNPNVLRGM